MINAFHKYEIIPMLMFNRVRRRDKVQWLSYNIFYRFTFSEQGALCSVTDLILMKEKGNFDPGLWCVYYFKLWT